VVGFAFFATPHGGAEVADVLKAVLKFTFSSRPFVDDLSPSSGTIKRLTDLFKDRVKELKLISFWESTASRPLTVCPKTEISHDLGGCTLFVGNYWSARRNRRIDADKRRSCYHCQVRQRNRPQLYIRFQNHCEDNWLPVAGTEFKQRRLWSTVTAL